MLASVVVILERRLDEIHVGPFEVTVGVRVGEVCSNGCRAREDGGACQPSLRALREPRRHGALTCRSQRWTYAGYRTAPD